MAGRRDFCSWALAIALFALPASAQEECDDWNSHGFFTNATAETVAACLEAGADVNARTDSIPFDSFLFVPGARGHLTPLHFASIYDWDGMVAVLLAAGARVNARSLDGATPLHVAARMNRNPAVVAQLVEGGADLNARDRDGNTPLHASRDNRSSAVPLLLLELGADPSLVNDSGHVASPLDCGYWNSEVFALVANAEATAACIAAGADVNARDDAGNTPLVLAVRARGGGTAGGPSPVSEDLAVVAVLLEAGADASARNAALHHAAAGAYLEAARSRFDPVETTAIVAALLAAGADVHARDGNAAIPLHHAASAEASETVTMLLDAGSDVQARDSNGDSPLLLAAKWGFRRNPEVLEILLGAGADVNDRNERGETVLRSAIRSPADRVAGIVRRLVDLGADATEPHLLWMAAVEGDNPELIEVLLAAGADPNPASGSSPLHGAARLGGPGAIAALVAGGAVVDARDSRGATPLHEAVEWKTPGAAALLEAGADVHARTRDGDTPLHLAAIWPPATYNRRDDPPEPDTLMVVALAAAGADVNARNDRGETPLHVATRNRHQPVVDKLLALGADAVAADALGRSPRPTVCDWMRRQFFQSTAWRSVLGCVQAGADVHARGEGGETPLHLLATQARVNPDLNEDGYPFTRVVAAFVEAGADVEARDRAGSTPLHHAVGRIHNRTTLVARALLAAGAEVTARDGLGGTPLHRAAGAEWPRDDSVVALLVEAGADVHATDDGGRTALHHAIRRDNPAIAARLVELGSDTAARDDSGHVANPVDCARFNTATFFRLASTETVAGCIEGGADVNASLEYEFNGPSQLAESTPLHFAPVWARDPAVVSLLVGAGAEVNARGALGELPLHAAAQSSDNPAMIVALIEAGAELGAWRPGIHSPYGWTPLHLAVERNRNPAITAALIEAGADVHARQEDGPTPLHDARSPEAVALLLEAGADLEARARFWGWRQPNGGDMTPLHVAAKLGNAAVFMALLEAGADPSAIDVEGKTPLDHAREQKALQQLEVVKRSGG